MKYLDTALQKKYEKEGYLFLREFSYKDRRIDGIAIIPWEVRQYHMVLFEFKQNRQDWLNELRNPAKQQPFYEFGGEYYFVAVHDEGETVIKPEEVPNGFGLMEWTEKEKLKIIKVAEARPEKYTIEFLMLFINKARKYYNGDAISDAYRQGMDNAEKGSKKRIQELNDRIAELNKAETEFREKTGIMSWQYDGVGQMADAFNAFRKAEDTRFQDLLKRINNEIKELKEYKSDIQTYLKNSVDK